MRNGKLVIDGNSSYVFQRKNTPPLLARDGLPPQDKLDAVAQLFREAGTQVDTTRRFIF